MHHDNTNEALVQIKKAVSEMETRREIKLNQEQEKFLLRKIIEIDELRGTLLGQMDSVMTIKDRKISREYDKAIAELKDILDYIFTLPEIASSFKKMTGYSIVDLKTAYDATWDIISGMRKRWSGKLAQDADGNGYADWQEQPSVGADEHEDGYAEWQLRGGSWADELEKLRSLPGAHHEALDGYEKIKNITNARALLNSFRSVDETPDQEINKGILSVETLQRAKKIKMEMSAYFQNLKWTDNTGLNTSVRENSSEMPPEFTPEVIENARRLGLEIVKLEGNSYADSLIERAISDGDMDITTPTGRKAFVTAWKDENSPCSYIPMPCVLQRDRDGNINWQNSDFWYLTKLKENRTVENLNGDAQEASTNFNSNEISLFDNWQETDFDAPEARNSHKSALLNELLGGGGKDGKLSTVNIRREDIDKALWGENPDQRIQTQRARDIIGKLGLNPDEFELRLIRQDEYARGSISKGWGQSNLSTNYENYFLGDGGGRYGLHGGRRAFGGPSRVYYTWRGYAHDNLAVRLVLSRKQ